ncbi:hypothetical protein CsSME_00053683 [Camellia sinensis var. sinensis]
MAEARRENVMSVELAIRREMAYRKKLASLRSHFDASMEDLMPLQFCVPGLIVIEMACAEKPHDFQVPSSGPSPRASSILGSSMSLVPTSLYDHVQTPNQFPRPGLILISSPSQALVPIPLYQVSSSNPPPNPWPLPAPIQIPSPSSLAKPRLIPQPSLSGSKRRATSSSLQCLPPRQPRPSHNNYVTVDQEGHFFCKVCQVPCSGTVTLKQHLKGHKHKAKLQWLQLSKRDGREKDDPHCKLCQIWCTNKGGLEMHLKGQKHQAKLQELEFGTKKEREKEAERPWCQLCQIWCMNEDALEQHLKGKNHSARLYATEGKRGMKGKGLQQ